MVDDPFVHAARRVLALAPSIGMMGPMSTPILIAAACLATNLTCANDLPRGKAEPKTAETACSRLGPGYVRAPGSDTCVRVGGSVRMEGAVLGR